MKFTAFFAAVMALAAFFQGAVAEAEPELRQATGNALNCASINLPCRVMVDVCGCDDPLCPPCPPCP